jgi:4-amino-4-deoxy-L-arabinose transferase-like glycosyltransferase
MLCRLSRKFEPDYNSSHRFAARSAASGAPTGLSIQLYAGISSPLLMFLVALFVRLAVIVYMQSFQIPSDQDHFRFGYETGRIARSIALGQGFSSPLHGPSGPTAWVPPVYPYLLAAIFKSFGVYSHDSALVMLTLNSLFSALTCLIVFFIGRKTFGSKVAVLAGWTWAFFPYAVWWSNWVWATTLSAFLFSLVFLAGLYLERRAQTTAWLAFGLLWGVVGLTDTALLSTLPLLIAWLYYRLKHRGTAPGRAVGAFTLSFALIVSPWIVRNYLEFGEFVFIRSNFGQELYQGNHEGSRGFSEGNAFHPANYNKAMEKLQQMGELSYLADTQRQALRFIMDNPSTFVWLTLKRTLYFWMGTPRVNFIFWLSGRFTAAKYALFASISLLAFLGLFLALRNRNPAVPAFAIVLLVFPIAYYITHPTPRYRHPIEPAMVVLAAYAATTIFSSRSLRERTRLIFRRNPMPHCAALPTHSDAGSSNGKCQLQA